MYGFQVKVPEFPRSSEWRPFPLSGVCSNISKVTPPVCPAWASVLLTPLLSLKSPSLFSTSCPLAPSFFCHGVCSLLLSASLLLDSITCHVSLCVSHSRSSGKSGWPPGYPLSELPESSRCIRLPE